MKKKTKRPAEPYEVTVTYRKPDPDGIMRPYKTIRRTRDPDGTLVSQRENTYDLEGEDE